MIFPFVWMALTSVNTVEEIMNIPTTIFPSNPSTKNYQLAVEAVPFVNIYSILSIFGRIVCEFLFSIMAAYGFANI